MQFNSFLFFVFFTITYSIYLCFNYRWQNRILLAASYFFYAAWDYRFTALIFFSTTIAFVAGRRIHNSPSRKIQKCWLIISVASSLSFLGFFKYFNFFADGLTDLLGLFGWGDHTFSLKIILPVGISFYTFLTISYVADIFKKKLTLVPSFFDFALYVSFFPQLLAGPIERATSLLPQICSKRDISSELVRKSAFLVLYGLFEKVVVADNLSVLVDNVYTGSNSDGFNVLIATYGFAFQIFADFDGYSNMAKGLAGLMGFRLVSNFKAPYFSETPSEFWSRWHISLSSWLRDYLYIPLGGNRGGIVKTARNLFVTMLLGGLWHGASWMFVFWGGFHGLLLVLYLPLKDRLVKMPGVLKRILFFHLICFGWLLFKSQSIEQFTHLTSRMLFNFHLTFAGDQILLVEKIVMYSSVPFIYQYLQYTTEKNYPIFDWHLVCRSMCYVVLFYMIVIFGSNEAQSFIYFQF